MANVTELLSAMEAGDPHAAGPLLPLVYDELRSLAAQRLAQESAGQTLEPTALVHEAYLRLVGRNVDQVWDSRGHFFAAAAVCMRRILATTLVVNVDSNTAASLCALVPHLADIAKQKA